MSPKNLCHTETIAPVTHRTRAPSPNTRPREAEQATWDSFYARESTPWASVGLSPISARLLNSYSRGKRLIEVGCGTSPDRLQLASLGFRYTGLDLSEEAIKRGAVSGAHLIRADFFKHKIADTFDVAYDKGFYHGLAGSRRRTAAARRISMLLTPGGIWVTVCGSADKLDASFRRGAIFLRDLVGPVEVYFEVLEVVKDSYGLLDTRHEFDAWHAAFRKR